MNKIIDKVKTNIDGIKFVEQPIYQNGDKGKDKLIRYISGRSFLLKAISGECDQDEIKTLHKVDSQVNDVILSLTGEESTILTNEEKNIINMNLFDRGPSQTISDEVDVKMRGTVADEIREFNRLLEEGEFRNHLPYYNSTGDLKKTRGWALCDPDYNPENNDIFFLVPKEEVDYFKEHGHFPLRADNNNKKLGKKWLYIAFQLAWVCSGDARGYCQCPDECYAKRMEITYKNVRDRVIRSVNGWQHATIDEKVDFYVNWISYRQNTYKRNGIRFCDTGDIPNQKLLDEVFEVVRRASQRLREKGLDPIGRFYIYSTRHDLDWSNKPWELVLNASNEELFNKVPNANWFRVVESFDDIPEEYKDPKTLHICNCNCKACNYCAVCRNTIIWEVLG